MQNYHDLQNTEAANVYLDKVKDNIRTVASNFSGTSFPTENLQAGMLCYRTDEKKLYQLTNTYPITWESVQSSLTFDSTPTTGSTNPVTSEGIKTALDKKFDASSGVVNISWYDNKCLKVGSSFNTNATVISTGDISCTDDKGTVLAIAPSGIGVQLPSSSDMHELLFGEKLEYGTSDKRENIATESYVNSAVNTAKTEIEEKIPAITVSGNTISFGSVTIGVD